MHPGVTKMHTEPPGVTLYQQICLWVLKENKRAIRFYQKCGFDSDGEEIYSTTVAASEIRMILKR